MRINAKITPRMAGVPRAWKSLKGGGGERECIHIFFFFSSFGSISFSRVVEPTRVPLIGGGGGPDPCLQLISVCVGGGGVSRGTLFPCGAVGGNRDIRVHALLVPFGYPFLPLFYFPGRGHRALPPPRAPPFPRRLLEF